MGLRIRGIPDELPPRLILHIGLALTLAPLILVKVLAARNPRTSRGLLSALGIAIFIVSFVIVALNVGTHFLQSASKDDVPLVVPTTLAVIFLALLVLGFLRKRAPAEIEFSAIAPPAVPGHREDECFTLRLARVDPQTHDAKTLRFLLPQGRRIAARPGQFMTFDWVIDGKSVSRSYSISSSPTQSAYVEITPKRVPNGQVSMFLNDSARPGLTVRAHGPFGRFCFDENKHHRIVLLAAGSGLTPMMAMLRYIDDLCLPVHAKLIYCIRTEADFLFKTELLDLQSHLRNFHLTLVLSQPSSDWNGWRGRLRREILEREVDRPGESSFFLCGPPAFMELARSLLTDMSVEPSCVLQESFGGAVTGSSHPIAGHGQLRITYARSSVTCNISAEKTLLESSEGNGILLRSGCRQGNCGTCATRLISGNVRMDNAEALTEERRAQGYILPCVSRPLEDVILDA